MANTQQCPRGHFYDPSIYSTCPYCNSAQQTKSSKMPWIITVVAVLVALFSLFVSYGGNDELEGVRKELAETRQKLADAEKRLAEDEKAIDEAEEMMKEAFLKGALYDELAGILGHGSDSYYAKIPVLVLKPGGSKGKIPVYCKMDTTIQYSIAYGGLSEDNTNFERVSDTLTAQWSGKWDNNWTDLEVTPGNEPGFYFIYFTNTANEDDFGVMVIVKQ